MSRPALSSAISSARSRGPAPRALKQFAGALLKTEGLARLASRPARIRAARFPARKSLEEFDFAFLARRAEPPPEPEDAVLEWGINPRWLRPSRDLDASRRHIRLLGRPDQVGEELGVWEQLKKGNTPWETATRGNLLQVPRERS